MSTSQRHGGFNALMFLDLDNFKSLNDRHGHTHPESTTKALGIAEKIRSTLSEPYLLRSEKLNHASISITHQCTASMGLFVFSGDEARPDELLKWTDAAMYAAKDAGRNQVHLFERNQNL